MIKASLLGRVGPIANVKLHFYWNDWKEGTHYGHNNCYFQTGSSVSLHF